MAAMRLPSAVHRWQSGWADLARHRDVPGCADAGRWRRLVIDLRFVASAPARAGSWRAALWCVALALAALAVTWTLGLDGWQRDALQCLPVLLAAPWVAAARRRFHQACAPAPAAAQAESGITDPATGPFHSSAIVAAERGAWNRVQTMRRRAGRAWAGWTSSWPWPASARWRPWRCRASRKSAP